MMASWFTHPQPTKVSSVAPWPLASFFISPSTVVFIFRSEIQRLGTNSLVPTTRAPRSCKWHNVTAAARFLVLPVNAASLHLLTCPRVGAVVVHTDHLIVGNHSSTGASRLCQKSKPGPLATNPPARSLDHSRS